MQGQQRPIAELMPTQSELSTIQTVLIKLGEISVMLGNVVKDMDKAASEREKTNEKLSRHDVELEQIRGKLDTLGKAVYLLLSLLVAQGVGALYWYFKLH